MKKIKVFMLRVNEDGIPFRGYLSEMEYSLEAEQEFVGGYIQVISLNENIDAVLNDEGKILQLPPNRVWFSEDGEPIDIICGNIFCCRHNDEGEFTDIKEEDIPVILKCLKPYLFGLIMREDFLFEYKD